ncbi:MAG: 50S ribosomal protein L9 [Bacteroidales bacterium]|jgi:large subunit ribosomal protein L9|nr:50S ribosomal protein L9 [Bacteroidales bacterium]HPJ82618.1 50S ribosomal protein L9 [Bacteroidales bacterium]
MEIILKQDVDNLGHKDDIVKVRNGYATNYLIPRGMAIMATASAVKMHQENMRQRAHKEAKVREDAQALAARLAACQIKIATKVSSNGKVFGSVNNIQVAEALAAQGIEVDRRNITFTGAEALKEVGVHEAVIKIYREISATIQVEVVGEE